MSAPGLVLVLLAAGCPGPEPAERVLGIVPDGIVEATLQLTPDSRHIVFVARRDEREALFINGRPGAEYDRVGRVLLADNGRWAHAGTRQGEGFVVRDGAESGPYERVGAMYLSADGRVLAYPVLEAGRRRLVVNGRPGEWYDNIRDVVGSPDGRLLAYTALLDSQWYVVVGQERHGPFADLGSPVAADDGSGWACAVQVGDSWALLADGRLRPERYEQVLSLRLDPRGPGEAMLIMRDRRFALVHNGRQSDLFRALPPDAIVFSDDLTHHAFVAFDGDSWRFVADGTAGPGFDAPAGPPVVGSNGSWAGVGVAGGRAVLFENGVAQGQYDKARVLAVKDEDGRVAWAAADGGAWYLLIGDEKHGPFAGIGGFEFSPDGRRYACVVSLGRSWVVVVDGERHQPFEAIIESPALFGPDGRTVAYAARREGRTVLVVDGVVQEPDYDGIRQVVFDGQGRINFIALRNDTLLAVSRAGF